MARKTFQNLMVEQQGKTVVFAFGRFNPPTAGHEKLISKVLELAQRNQAEPRIYPSFTQDKKKNPLSPKDKIKFLKLMTKFPKIIQNNSKIITPFIALQAMSQEGFDTVVFVVGSDRVKKFQSEMGVFAQKLKIKNFKVISAGTRDPDSEDVEGMSASKMRKAASSGDINLFNRGAPSKINDKFKQDMFDKVRRGLGLKKINESIPKEIVTKLVGISIPKMNINERLRFSFDNFTGVIDNMLVSKVRLCDTDIDYDKAARMSQTANDAYLSNIFHISEDGFLLGDTERFLAYKRRDESGVVKVRKLSVSIKEIFMKAQNILKEENDKMNEQFEKDI